MIRLLRLITPTWLKSRSLDFRNYQRRNNRHVAKFFPRYFALNEIDRKLEKYLSHKHGFFVELGANDGITQSNTKYFELFRKWKGVLIEPNPQKWLECSSNRSKYSSCINAACVSFEFEGNSVNMLYSNLMTISLDGESDIPDKHQHADWGKDFLNDSEVVYEFIAPARTLESILSACNAPQTIDFLSLDVEGNEIEVLKGVDLINRRFTYMLIETRGLSKINEYLLSFEYSVIDQLSPHDYLFLFKSDRKEDAISIR